MTIKGTDCRVRTSQFHNQNATLNGNNATGKSHLDLIPFGVVKRHESWTGGSNWAQSLVCNLQVPNTTFVSVPGPGVHKYRSSRTKEDFTAITASRD